MPGRAPLELTLEDVDTRSPRFFQFVFAHIRPTADLLSLRQACRSVFFSQDAASTPADDYMPHLSLAYGDKGAGAILNNLRSAASGGGRTAPTDGGRWAMDGRSFRVGAVEVWSCEGPPAEWADAAVKQILLQLDENAGRRRFIIADLDETHVLISPDAVERVRVELEDALEANHWNPLAVEEQ
ncbi:hypothetical protein RHOSPDRAFT_32547 [Rhodotorula sp. JG-1b]|nr:hypothetical protein RHOSPDRAFT_32547 [Rhodotorula sp. JG-1b]